MHAQPYELKNLKTYQIIAKISMIYSIILLPVFILGNILNYYAAYLLVSSNSIFNVLNMYTNTFLPTKWLLLISYFIYPIVMFFFYKSFSEENRPTLMKTVLIVWAVGLAFMLIYFKTPYFSSQALLCLISLMVNIILLSMLKKAFIKTPPLSTFITLFLVVSVIQFIQILLSAFHIAWLLSIILLGVAALVLNIIFSARFLKHLNTRDAEKTA